MQTEKTEVRECRWHTSHGTLLAVLNVMCCRHFFCSPSPHEKLNASLPPDHQPAAYGQNTLFCFPFSSFTYSRPTKLILFLCNLEIQKSQPNLSASDAFQVFMRLFYLFLLLKSRSMLFCRFLPLYGCQEYSFIFYFEFPVNHIMMHLLQIYSFIEWCF